jgi:hypothetical protein
VWHTVWIFLTYIFMALHTGDIIKYSDGDIAIYIGPDATPQEYSDAFDKAQRETNGMIEQARREHIQNLQTAV